MDKQAFLDKFLNNEKHLQMITDEDYDNLYRAVYATDGVSEEAIGALTDSLMLSGIVNSISDFHFTELKIYMFDTSIQRHIIIPEGITIIGHHCFKGAAVETIQLPLSLEKIYVGAFRGSRLTAVEIPENVTWIGPFAFSFCEQLKEVIINNTTDPEGYLSPSIFLNSPVSFNIPASWPEEAKNQLAMRYKNALITEHQ